MWLLKRLQGAFLMGVFFLNEQIAFINRMVYNCTMLMEVENDNIGYDQRIV